MWERTICGIRAGELDISAVRGIGNTYSSPFLRLNRYTYPGLLLLLYTTTVEFNLFDSVLSTLPNSTLDTNDHAVRMLGYCTPPARHRRYPTYRPLPGNKGNPHTVT